MKKLFLAFLLCLINLSVATYAAEYDTQRGFNHPGCLHSQADFDRILRQLADGNKDVQAGLDKLRASKYASSTFTTYPTETIVRGGGVGENYINAARGSSAAYLNAIEWKLGFGTAHAEKAIEILNQWARTCTGIGGDSNYALAAGLYGYAFVNAAELMRDYAGWKKEDQEQVKKWFHTVWYPSALGFLRGRNGTWQNAGKWWEAPGHYWSNWGLCNTLCVMSIGIYLDDPFIYNQGISFYKYDHVGSFQNMTPQQVGDGYIWNWGLTEFIGNLVPIESDCTSETMTAFGKISQMQESGRDQGHSSMAASLAVDICQTGFSQGDDLFALLNDRLAGGLEHVAAYNIGEVDNLPFTTYRIQASGYTVADGRGGIHTGDSPATRGQCRPGWVRALSYYEGLRGVTMKYGRMARDVIGVEGGPGYYGETSGGFDHLGYGTLLNNIPACQPADAIHVLKTSITVGQETLNQTNMGGISDTYVTNSYTGVVPGTVLTLRAELPADCASERGTWSWNTGATTSSITITANKSQLYRVTYTSPRGIKSQACFAIGVQGDSRPDPLTVAIEGDVTVEGNIVYAVKGGNVVIRVSSPIGWSSVSGVWDDGTIDGALTLTNIQRNATHTYTYTNQNLVESKYSVRVVVDPDEEVASNSYYLYNVGSGRFLDGANRYATQASLLAQPSYMWEIVPVEGDLYTIKWAKQGNGLFMETNNNASNNEPGGNFIAWCDRNNQDHSLWQILPSDGAFCISINPDDAAYGTQVFGNTCLGYMPDRGLANPLVNPLVPMDDNVVNGMFGKWLFLTADEYSTHQATLMASAEARQAITPYIEYARRSGMDISSYAEMMCAPSSTAANLEAAKAQLLKALNKAMLNADATNPVDVTYLLQNPNCADAEHTGWDMQNGDVAWSSNTNTHQIIGAMMGGTGGRYYEQWIGGTASLPASRLSQTISLPNGNYTLSADGIATYQNGLRKNDVVFLFAGTQQTKMFSDVKEGTLRHYSVDFTVTDGEIELGLVNYGGLFNWIAIDNFRLVCNGLTPADVMALEDNEVYFIQNECGLYLTNGGNWGTQTTLSATPAPVRLHLEDGKYRLEQVGLGNIAVSVNTLTDVYSDAGTDRWHLMEIENARPTDMFTIRCVAAGETAGYLVPGAVTDFATITANGTEETENNKWRFIRRSDVVAELDKATRSIPVDASTLFYGGSCPGGKTVANGRGANINGRTMTNEYSGWTVASGNWSANDNNTEFSGRFYEQWTPSTGRLAGGELVATINDLPAGRYEISVDMIATLQSDPNNDTHTGIFLRTNKQEIPVMTKDQTAKTITAVVFKSAKQPLRFSILCRDCDVNWMALDQVRVVYYGPLPTIPELLGMCKGTQTANLMEDINQDGHITVTDVSSLIELLRE